jgi:hypothetical protein
MGILSTVNQYKWLISVSGTVFMWGDGSNIHGMTEGMVIT